MPIDQRYIPNKSKLAISIIFYLGILALLGWITLPGQNTTNAQKSATPTIVPLSMSVAEWIQILHPTEDCPLPCWWDITPGVTAYEQAKTIIYTRFEGIDRRETVEIGNLQGNTFFGSGMRIQVEDEFEGQLDTRLMYVGVRAEDHVVNLIDLSAGSSGYEEIILAFDYFNLLNMLDLYGVPTLIRVGIWPDEKEDTVEGLVFYWETIGTTVVYVIQDSSLNPPQQFQCFDPDSLESIDIYLQPIQANRSYDEINPNYGYAFFYTKPLPEITNIMADRLVETIIKNNGCLPHGTIVN